MGREDDVKGFWHQLKAMAAVIEEEEKAGEEHTGLIIIGDGAYTGYRKLAADLGIGRDVYFTGLLRWRSASLQLLWTAPPGRWKFYAVKRKYRKSGADRVGGRKRRFLLRLMYNMAL